MNRAYSGAVDSDSTNQVLRGIVGGVLDDCLDLDDYALTDTAKEIVDTLREQAWIRGPAERRRAMKRFDRDNRRSEPTRPNPSPGDDP